MLQRAIKCDVSIHRGSSHIDIKGRLVNKSLFKSELKGDNNMCSIGKYEGDENFTVSVFDKLHSKKNNGTSLL